MPGRWMNAAQFKAHTGKNSRGLEYFRSKNPELCQGKGEPTRCGTNEDGTAKWRYAEYRYHALGWAALCENLIKL